MTDLTAAAAVLATLGVVFGPGAAVLASAGLRGLALAALAPVVGTGLLAVAAVAADLAGLSWGWPVAAVAVAAGVGLAVVVRRAAGRPHPLLLRDRGRRAAVQAGGVLAVAAVLAVLPLRAGMNGLRTEPRTPDATTHLALLRALDGGAPPSLLSVVPVTGPDGVLLGERPSAWHDLVATVLSLTGADAALAANLSAVVLAGLVLPLGTAYACGALLPWWRWAAPAGMLAGTAFVGLPTLVVSFGTLWPYAWSVASIPAVLGAVVAWTRPHRSREGGRSSATPALVVAAALAGVGASHPRGLLALVVLAGPLVVAAAGRRWVRLVHEGGRSRALVEGGTGAAVLVAALAAGLAVTAGRPTAAPVMSVGQAVGEALLDSPLGEFRFGVPGTAWLLGAAVLGGVLAAVRTPGLRAWAASWLLAVVLYTVAASADPGALLRRAVTSWWLDDPLRLAALLPVVAAPLVVVAADAARRALPRTLPVAVRGTLAGVAALVVLALLSLDRAEDRRDRVAFDYTPGTATPASIRPGPR